MERKVRVLFATPEFDQRFCGGLGTVVNELSLPLAAEVELDVLLLAIRKHGSLLQNLVFSTLYRLKEGAFKKVSVKLYKRAFKIIKHYDIIHFFHYSNEIVEILDYIHAGKLPVKTVFSCHYLLKYERDIRCIYSGLLKIEEKIYEGVDCIHVLTRASREALFSCYPQLKKKSEIHVIPNGVKKEEVTVEFPMLEEHVQPEDRIILTVTRWCHGKGLEYLLDAVPHVLAEEKNVKFVLGGRKLKSWENNVHEYVAEIDRRINPLRKNVISLGWLGKEQMQMLYKMSTVWIMPSELEYFPYSLLEPMINRLPIITTRFPGYSEILEEGKECLAYEATDGRELASKILSLLRDGERRGQLAENAYRRVTTDYAWPKVAREYAAMYKAMVK